MAAIQTGPSRSGLQRLAIPAVCLLILFLGYSSQYTFNAADDRNPGPMSRGETITFNVLLLCVWWTYYKACSVDPGRYEALPSSDSSEPSSKKQDLPDTSSSPEPAKPPGAAIPPSSSSAAPATTARWCKKCQAPKPPRAHHCRHCGRCVPRMDHHCPWTGTCVSLQTFPHFVRFLAWTNAALWCLGYLLWRRFLALWEDRNLPAYLGPSLPRLVHLVLLALVGAGTAFALGVLLFSTTRGWALNQTMIEGWEVERHEAVLARYGDYDDEEEDGSGGGAEDTFWADGTPVLEKIEFPYDIGIFANMAQAMGTGFAPLWLFPFAGGPRVNNDGTGKGTGWEWPENGFNRRKGMWPPPDPEKIRRARNGWPGAEARLQQQKAFQYDEGASPEEVKAAFQRRQAADMRRRQGFVQGQESGIIAELEEEEELFDIVGDDPDVDDFYEQGMDGEPGWTNSDGDRLRDYGVDEDVEDEEFIPLDQDDDDVPIGELLRRRRAVARDDDDV